MEDVNSAPGQGRVGTGLPACAWSPRAGAGEQHGVWRTIALMWRLRAAYAAGRRPMAWRCSTATARGRRLQWLCWPRRRWPAGQDPPDPALGCGGAARAQRRLAPQTLATVRAAATGPITRGARPMVSTAFRMLQQRQGGSAPTSAGRRSGAAPDAAVSPFRQRKPPPPVDRRHRLPGAHPCAPAAGGRRAAGP